MKGFHSQFHGQFHREFHREFHIHVISHCTQKPTANHRRTRSSRAPTSWPLSVSLSMDSASPHPMITPMMMPCSPAPASAREPGGAHSLSLALLRLPIPSTRLRRARWRRLRSTKSLLPQAPLLAAFSWSPVPNASRVRQLIKRKASQTACPRRTSPSTR